MWRSLACGLPQSTKLNLKTSHWEPDFSFLSHCFTFCLFSILALSSDSLLLPVDCWTVHLSEEAVLLKWHLSSHLSVPRQLCSKSTLKFVWQMAASTTEELCGVEACKCTHYQRLVGELQCFVFQLTLYYFLALQMRWRYSCFMNTKHKVFIFFPWSIWTSQ